MTRRWRTTVAALAAAAGGCLPGPTDPTPGALVITHATVLAMDGEGVLSDHTVVMDGGRIRWVGPATEAAIPDGATVVDARGGWVLPGLADMHVHTWEPEDALLCVAHGVTTVRNMWGTEVQLALQIRIASGELIGPTLVTAGAILDGDPPRWEGSRVVTTGAGARAAVRAVADGPFDFVKVYDGLSAEVYRALVDEAGRLGVPLAGHVPVAVGLEGVIDGPQRSIEHLHRYPTLLQSPASPDDRALGESGWLTADPRRMAELARRLADDGVWSTPTLVLRERMGLSPAERAEFVTRPEVRWVAPELRSRWEAFALPPGASELIRTGQRARRAMVRALADAGAPLLAGSDVGNPWLVPGLSLVEELEQLVAAGLPPHEALAAATRSPAAFLGQSGEFGVVRPGARADLVLVRSDPLADVGVLRTPDGVVVRGRWLPREELRRRLDEQAGG